MDFDISNLLLQISVLILLIALNSILIHYIIEKFKFNDKSFDNPTTIALILGVLFYINTLINFNLIFFILILVIMVYSIKYLYNVNIIESIKVTSVWLLSIFLISVFLSLFYFLIY